ncbi:MAG: CBS and ACT domain-containing protein [Desulfobacterales bacterium]|jgi:acetoin utilization protein AcuB
MLVKKWMSKNTITVGPNDTVIKALILLNENNITRLPVIENAKIVGMVTERDLRRASFPSETLKVENVMTRNPITVLWNYTISEVAETLLKHNISGVPVTGAQGELIGIITKDDLFRVLVTHTGVEEKGILLALLADDRPGSIKEITDIIRAGGGRMMSVLTNYDNAPKGYLRVYLRMYGIDRDKFHKIRKLIAKKATFLYWVDYRHNMRDIYRVE